MAVGQMRQTIFKDDPNASLFQQAINDQFSQMGKIPFINGNQINDISLLANQANVIDHKLGRKAVGYFIILNSDNTPIWNDAIVSDTSITLKCSAPTTVSIWVF